METFDFNITNKGFSISISAIDIKSACDILDYYIEKHNLDWCYIYV